MIDLRFVKRDGKMILQFRQNKFQYIEDFVQDKPGSATITKKVFKKTGWQDVRIEEENEDSN